MQNIIILGDYSSGILTETIIDFCSANGGVLYSGGSRLYKTNEAPAFQIFSLISVSELNMPGSIVVFGSSLDGISEDIDLYGCTAVLDSSNAAALRRVSMYGCGAVGCSMSGHDTLTVSGMTDESTIMLSLRRTLKTAGGMIEPYDFIVKIQPDTPVYPVLAAAAVILLSGTEL